MVLGAILMLAGSAPAQASGYDLSSIFGKGGDVADMVEGLFSKSDLTVKDIAGTWVSEGSAVCFRDDNFLKKAGGVAAAQVVEKKIDPYFEKYGLTGAVVTIKEDSSFTMKIKGVTLSGTIERNDDKTFNFRFKAMNKISLGAVKTYVQKQGKTLDIMFDATKLRALVTAVGKYAKIEIAKTFGTILESYDGICIGFSMKKQ